MQATGNGFSLSSTTVRGLGMVVQFAYDVGTPQPVKIIPSQAADKMLCGIIPGDPDLVGRDFPIIGDDYQVSLVRNALQDLGVSKVALKELPDRDLWRRMQWFD